MPCQINMSKIIPTIIRYTPQIRNPYFFKNAIKNLIAINATMNATMFPNANKFICSRVNAPFSLVYL